MLVRSRLVPIAALVLLAGVSGAPAQMPTAGARPGAQPPAPHPYVPRIAGGAMETERFRSAFVNIGGATQALLYEPKAPAGSGRVAVVYANRGYGFGPPAIELASRGYRVLHVSAPLTGPVQGLAATPYEDFQEVSKGIRYLRSLPGIERVVVAGWGAGASTIMLYAAIAEKGPAICRGKRMIYPCTATQASGFARPDGIILFDTGFGSGVKAASVDPGRSDLDRKSAANGYDPATDTAHYSADFRKRYFAAQATRYNQVIDAALVRLKALGGPAGTQDEPMRLGNLTAATALYGTDLTLMSHTKRPHLLLKADGTRPTEVLRSVRPTQAALPAGPPPRPGAPRPEPRVQSLREFLASDAIRTTRDFAITEDNVRGVDWASSNLGTPYQAESVTVPALLLTNTCFMFVVSAEIVLDHLASKDKTQVGIEGSEHEFTPCKPEYGDTKKRLFDYTADWLGKPGRF